MLRVVPRTLPVMAMVALAFAPAACSGDDDAVAPVTTFPPGLDACDAVTDGDTAEPCLDAIERKLAVDTLVSAGGEPADGDDFAAAVEPIAESFRLMDVETSFDQQPPTGDEATTVPIRTMWRIAGAERVLWTCFDDVDVTVSTAEC